MREVHVRLVRRRGREFAWIIVTRGRRQIRRTFIDAETGEILDDVWRGRDGRTHSYSAAAADRPDPGHVGAVERARARHEGGLAAPEGAPPAGASLLALAIGRGLRLATSV